jgi:hypothetical protein
MLNSGAKSLVQILFILHPQTLFSASESYRVIKKHFNEKVISSSSFIFIVGLIKMRSLVINFKLNKKQSNPITGLDRP